MSEVYRIDIPIDVKDNTEAGFRRASANVGGFERSMRSISGRSWDVRLNTVDKASAVVSRVSDRVSHLSRSAWTVTVRAVDLATAPLRAIWRMASSLGGLIAGGAAAYGGVFAPLQMADDLTRANTGFKTFLGSADKASKFLADIQKFGADTPFESDWLTSQATTLLPALNKDPRMVMRTLKGFGDAGALTGASTSDIELALQGFRQIGSVGTLSMEELRQVTENLRVPLSLITDELGVAQSEVKDLGRKGIPAAKAMDAILRALERPVDKGGFAGGMAAQMETLSGQFSMLKDNFKLNLVQRWGQGLEAGAIPLLKEFNGLFSAGADTVKSWGDMLYRTGQSVSGWFVERVQAARRAVEGMTNSLAWQGAATPFDKMKVAWRQLIVQPFEEWWAGEGEGWVTAKAAAMGQGFGSALGGFLASALGIASGGASDNAFMQAGQTAGTAFFNAFLEAFDAKQIALKLAHETGKVMPGGESPTVATGVGVVAAGWLAKKGFDAWTWIRNLRGGGAAGPVMPGGATAPLATQAAAPAEQAAKTIVDQYGRTILTVGEQAAGQTATASKAVPWYQGTMDWLSMGAQYNLGALKEFLGISTGVGAVGTGYAAAAGMTTGGAALSVGGGAIVGGALAYAIGTALTSYLDSEEQKRQAKLDETARRLNPTGAEKAALANTPATIGAAKPELSFWENLFLSPWAKNQREAKWEKEQAAAREAALANWRPPVAAGMTDQEEQDSLRRVYRAIRTANAETAPAPASPPPQPKIEIKVDYRPNIPITTAATVDDVLKALNANHGVIVDDIADRLANAYSTVRANMPRVRQPIAE